jgi:hypothetical protein
MNTGSIQSETIAMKQDTKATKKNLRWYMRWLHNKIGFFIVGLVIIYSLSGLVQTYRDTNFLKHEVLHEMKLSPGLPETELGSALKLRNFKIVKTKGSIQYFKDGTYDTQTGMAKYTSNEWYSWIKPFTELHKTSSKNVTHYFTTVFGFALLFMSISAFWMFKPGTKLFSSGVYYTIAGIIASVILLVLS